MSTSAKLFKTWISQTPISSWLVLPVHCELASKFVVDLHVFREFSDFGWSLLHHFVINYNLETSNLYSVRDEFTTAAYVCLCVHVVSVDSWRRGCHFFCCLQLLPSSSSSHAWSSFCCGNFTAAVFRPVSSVYRLMYICTNTQTNRRFYCQIHSFNSFLFRRTFNPA